MSHSQNRLDVLYRISNGAGRYTIVMRSLAVAVFPAVGGRPVFVACDPAQILLYICVTYYTLAPVTPLSPFEVHKSIRQSGNQSEKVIFATLAP